MIDIYSETCEINGVEIIFHSDGKLWLNEKHVEEGLDYKHLQVTTVKYASNFRKHRYELVDDQKNKPKEVLYKKNWQPN